MSNSYRVEFEQDTEGWIVLEVPEVPGCRTQAQTFGEGLLRIREALSLFVDDAETAQIVFSGK